MFFTPPPSSTRSTFFTRSGTEVPPLDRHVQPVSKQPVSKDTGQYEPLVPVRVCVRVSQLRQLQLRLSESTEQDWVTTQPCAEFHSTQPDDRWMRAEAGPTPMPKAAAASDPATTN